MPVPPDNLLADYLSSHHVADSIPYRRMSVSPYVTVLRIVCGAYPGAHRRAYPGAHRRAYPGAGCIMSLSCQHTMHLRAH